MSRRCRADISKGKNAERRITTTKIAKIKLKDKNTSLL
jgi:hypothetical protein